MFWKCRFDLFDDFGSTNFSKELLSIIYIRCYSYRKLYLEILLDFLFFVFLMERERDGFVFI